MFCGDLLLAVRTSAVTKKYWRRSAACCLVKTTTHRIACLSSSNGFARTGGYRTKLPNPLGPALCGLSWCCIFVSPPRGSAAADAGPSWVGGTRGMPSGEIWRDLGGKRVHSIGLRRSAAECGVRRGSMADGSAGLQALVSNGAWRPQAASAVQGLQALVSLGGPKPQGPEILDLGAGARRQAAQRWPTWPTSDPPGCWRWDGVNMANNAAIGAHQPPRGVAPKWLFGPGGVLARGACRGRRGGPGFLPNRPGFTGVRNKSRAVVLRLRGLNDLCA
jgi:hypothetical protein